METEVMIDVETATVEELQEAHRRGLLWTADIPEYQVWKAMRQRCKPNHHQYRYYGARGITVCGEWIADFWCWFHHIGRRPTIPGFVISQDRTDNEKGYLPGNVRWVSGSQQQNNARNNGEYNSQSMLTWAQVREIRRLRGTASPNALAKVFGTTPKNIHQILRGDRWPDKAYQPGDRKAFVKHMQPWSATGEQSDA
jgi:hypothetical protein